MNPFARYFYVMAILLMLNGVAFASMGKSDAPIQSMVFIVSALFAGIGVFYDQKTKEAE